MTNFSELSVEDGRVLSPFSRLMLLLLLRPQLLLRHFCLLLGQIMWLARGRTYTDIVQAKNSAVGTVYGGGNAKEVEELSSAASYKNFPTFI